MTFRISKRSILEKWLVLNAMALLLFLVGLTGSALAATTEKVQQITWRDLVPQVEVYNDPFLELTSEQKLDLVVVSRTRQLQSDGVDITPEQTERLHNALKRLEKDNIDIDGLLALREGIAAKRKHAMEAVNETLDEQQVRLAGYVLPLEMDGLKITELLLVPYVGACIHEPVPPANQIMTDAELQRLMAVLDTDPARTPCLVIKWLLYTACRKGEALQLRWSDINRDNNTWTIQAATAKSKKRRVVPLSASALAILDELSQGNNSEYVFLNSRNGERLQSVDKLWNTRLRKAANLPRDIVLHSMRHQGASMALSSGADLATVRDLLGHADISTTEKYLHASSKSLQSGAAGIEDYMEKALARKVS